MVSGINNDTAYNPQLMLRQIKDTFLKNFTASYDKIDHEKEKELDKKINLLVNDADTDKDGKLSLDELSSLDTSDNPERAKLVHNLINSFDNYDKNNDNELSVKELKEAFNQLEKQFSQQDIAKMYKENEEFNNSKNPFQIAAGDLSNSLAKKLISNYKTNDPSILKSFLNTEG